jgi:hypothetical protein
MDILLANPWGLLALAALPALVVIHSLRQATRRVPTSTLFLLDHAGPEPVGGLRLDSFRQALPFWMQVLASLALTWLLVEPRFIRADSRQTVAVVLDSSASMVPFRDATLTALKRQLRRLKAVAGHTDWHLLETGPRRPPLYAGDRLDELLGAADRWWPSLGTHDFSPSLALASSLAPPDRGAVILVTDRPVVVTPGVALLSTGTEIDNVGISGADVVADASDRATDADDDRSAPAPAGLRFRALVTNQGKSPAVRTLTVRAGDARSIPDRPVAPPTTIELDPGQSRTIEAPWPAGAERLILELDADRFTLDDRAALVRPRPRVVRVAVRSATDGGDLLGRMVVAAADTELVSDADQADLVIEPFGTDGTVTAVQVRKGKVGDEAGSSGEKQESDAVSSVDTPPPQARIDPAPLVADDHPLVGDLAWNGLLSGPAGALGIEAGDTALVWKGDAALLRLRTRILPTGSIRETLLFDFDVDGSTAARSPALVVLLDRFADRVRAQIDRPWSATFQAGEAITLPPIRATITAEPISSEPQSTPLSNALPFRGRAPAEPGFFTVRRDPGAADDTPLLSGAVQQADARESDFSAAAAIDTVDEVRLERVRRQTVADPFLPGWVALAAAALLAAWAWSARRRAPTEARL